MREGARRMGVGLTAFQTWCSERSIVRLVLGRRRVIWGDVLDSIRGVIVPPVAPPVVQSRPRLPTAKVQPRRLTGAHRGTST